MCALTWSSLVKYEFLQETLNFFFVWSHHDFPHLFLHAAISVAFVWVLPASAPYRWLSGGEILLQQSSDILTARTIANESVAPWEGRLCAWLISIQNPCRCTSSFPENWAKAAVKQKETGCAMVASIPIPETTIPIPPYATLFGKIRGIYPCIFSTGQGKNASHSTKTKKHKWTISSVRRPVISPSHPSLSSAGDMQLQALLKGCSCRKMECKSQVKMLQPPREMSPPHWSVTPLWLVTPRCLKDWRAWCSPDTGHKDHIA